MENPNGLYFVSFTPKGYLVNQMLQEGWGWHEAQRHASRLFSADGTQPAQRLAGTELQNVNVWIAACDQPAASVAADDYLPRAEDVPACGGLEVRA